MKAILSAILLLLCFARLSHAAEVISVRPFSVDVGPALSVRCNGKTIITGDRCLSLRGPAISKSPPLLDTTQGKIIRVENAFTLLSSRGRNRLRREVSVTPQGVEITFEMRVFGSTGGTHLLYDLIAPADLLGSATCAATTGQPRDNRPTKPVVFDMAAVKAEAYHLRSLVYLSIPQVPCTLDFNPQGAWIGEGNYGEAKSVTTLHDGKQWHFVSFCSGATEGAIFTGKVILRSGTLPYDAFHDRLRLDYVHDFPVTLALNFSDKDGDKRYQACPVPVPAAIPCQWQSPASVRIVTRDKGGVLYRDFAAPAAAEGETTLELKQRAGLYLLTLNVCDTAEKTGPFSIVGPQGPIFEGVSLKPGEHWVKTIPLRFRNGKASLRFRGNWKLNALALQAILYEPEDFLFDRPFWTMTNITEPR